MGWFAGLSVCWPVCQSVGLSVCPQKKEILHNYDQSNIIFKAKVVNHF